MVGALETAGGIESWRSTVRPALAVAQVIRSSCRLTTSMATEWPTGNDSATEPLAGHFIPGSLGTTSRQVSKRSVETVIGLSMFSAHLICALTELTLSPQKRTNTGFRPASRGHRRLRPR